ncbi:MAG: zf-HC2 domain-containing protein [Desulfobacteraceae bacterium]|jgi:anti-sigma factor RsiW
MKDCADIKQLLYPYLDGELDVKGNLDVEAHILDCQTCCDLLNEKKRFLSVLKHGCLQEQGPPALKAMIERKLLNKQRFFSRFFSNHPFKAVFATAMAGIFLILFGVQLFDLGFNRTPPFVRASVEHHLRVTNGNLPLEIQSNDPRMVVEWFKERIDFMPHLPKLKDDEIVLLGGRLAKFKGEHMALISYTVDKSPITMAIIKGNPTAYVESRDFLFMKGRRFNFSNKLGHNAISWTDDGNNFTLVSRCSSRDIMSCKVCHANGSGLSDLNALLGI